MTRGSKNVVKRSDKKPSKPTGDALRAQRPAQLDSEKLKDLYSAMLKCRMLGERARTLVREGVLSGDFFTPAGQEAAEVGALIDLVAEDCIAPGRRDRTIRFLRGTPLKFTFTELCQRKAREGSASASSRRQERHAGMIAPALSLSAQLNIAIGAAWAAKIHGTATVAVTFSGDDSISLGFWRDVLDFSVVHKLPMLHVIHNNAGDGTVGDRVALPGTVLGSDSQNPGLPTFVVDGNDAVAVYRVAQEAIRRARQGHGPSLIDCQTYRWCSQLETDSAKHMPAAARPDHEDDPLALMETYLNRKGLWSERWKHKLMERFSRELDKAVKFAELARRAA